MQKLGIAILILVLCFITFEISSDEASHPWRNNPMYEYLLSSDMPECSINIYTDCSCRLQLNSKRKVFPAPISLPF